MTRPLTRLAIALCVLTIVNYDALFIQCAAYLYHQVLLQAVGAVKALIVLIPPLIIGLAIDYKAVVYMFFSDCMMKATHATKKVSTKNQTHIQMISSSVFNWIIGATCLLTMTKTFFVGQKQYVSSGFDPSPWNRVVFEFSPKYDGSILSKFYLLLWFASLSFLVGQFMIHTTTSKLGKNKSNSEMHIWLSSIYHCASLIFVISMELSVVIRVGTFFISAAFFLSVVNYLRVRPSHHTTTELQYESDLPSQSNSKDDFYTKIDVDPTEKYVEEQRIQTVFDLAIGVLLFSLVTGVPESFRLLVSIFIGIFYAINPIFSVINWCLMQRFGSRRLNYSHHSQETMQSRFKTYNSPFPNGWYALCLSDELPRASVKYVRILGEHFAVFRGDSSGKVYALNAFCPHLGANLAIGGTVCGDQLECIFHKWKFSGDGSCAEVPYCDQPPSFAKTRAWFVCEFYGLVLVWYHAESSPPLYYPKIVPQISNGNQKYVDKWEIEVNMHIQEFTENSTDFQHFGPLHGKMMLPFTEFELPGLTVNHRPDWSIDSESPHIAYFFDHANLNFFGKEIPRSNASAKITITGPASVVMFTFDTELGSISLFQTHSPLGPMKQLVRFRWYAEKSLPRVLVWYVVGSWITQWKNDLIVWENKIFLKNPALLKQDGPMFKQRNWFKQFYSPQSKTSNFDW